MTDSTLTDDRPETGSVPVPDATKVAPRDKLVINLLLVSAFVVFLNETVMGVAIPRLLDDLDIVPSQGQWLTTAFLLTMSIVIPITGFLLQRLNTRPVFILAMTLFSIGTLICAVAPSFEPLVAGRVVQATGTAIMMPLLMTTVMQLVPPAARGKTMGNISIVMSVAPAVGPMVSGLILSVLEWRWLFILVLPIAIGALLLGAARVRNVTEPKKVPVDYLSIVLSAFAFGGIVYGLSQLGEVAKGLEPANAWGPAGIGVVALALFVARQLRLQRSDRALLDLRTFRFRNFSVAVVLMTVMMATLFGSIILLPIYTVRVLGLDELVTGLLLLPGGLLMGLLGPVVGRLYDRYGPRVLVVPGSVTVSAALWFMTMFADDSPVYMVLIAHVILSLGLAFMFTPLFTAGLGALEPRFYAHGSAIVGTVQQVAGAAGTALFVTIFTAQSFAFAAEGAGQVAAEADGIRLALSVGATISLATIAVAFFVRKPDDTSKDAPLAH